MGGNPRACVKIVQLCLMTAAAQGLSVPEILREYELDPGQLSDPYTRVSHALITRLWQEIPERTGDAAFGLHAAEHLHNMTFDAFDAALRNCRTGGDILRLLLRNVRLMHEAAVIDLEFETTQEGRLLRCTERFLPPAVIPRHLGELIVAMWVLRMRRLLSPPPAIHELTFKHPAPPDLSEHARIFGAPLIFSAPEYSMAMPASSLDQPVVGADPMLGVVLGRHLQQEAEKLPPADDFLTQVQATARQALSDPELGAEHLARRLHLSQRTLQRRLTATGTSCQAIIDGVRREKALLLLRDPRLTLAEIAFTIGYSEMSAFYRAFRRWTGKTPREVRDSIVA